MQGWDLKNREFQPYAWRIHLPYFGLSTRSWISGLRGQLVINVLAFGPTGY